MQMRFEVDVQKVFDEVAQKSAYVGAKIVDESGTEYDRIATIDEDEAELRQFFGECRVELAERMARMLAYEGEDDGVYAIDLTLDDRFNSVLKPAVELSLFNFFVYGILARWCTYTKPELVAQYAEQSNSMLDSVYSRTIKRIFERKQSTI